MNKIYRSTKTNVLGAPKHGIEIKDGEKVRAVRSNPRTPKPKKDEFVVTKPNGEEVIKKGKRLELNYFTLFETRINFEEEGVSSNKSLVAFRFHSSKAFCEKSYEDHIKEHGGVHARYFIYDGIDKTEQELVDWALATDQVANDGKTKVFGAVELGGTPARMSMKPERETAPNERRGFPDKPIEESQELVNKKATSEPSKNRFRRFIDKIATFIKG